jgi:hypothetical protein
MNKRERKEMAYMVAAGIFVGALFAFMIFTRR